MNLVGTVSRLSQKIDTQMLDGTPVSGTAKSTGWGASVEVGHQFHFPLAGEHVAAAFVEPSLQLSAYHIEGDDYALSNQMSVKGAGFTSVTLRAGMSAGLSLTHHGEAAGELWASTGVLHELRGKSEMTVNGTHFENDLLGNRVYYGLGMDWAFTKSFKAYGTIERQHGHQMRETLGVNLGVKWSF